MKSESPEPPSTDIRPRKRLLARAFDRTFWMFVGLAIVAGLLCWAFAGTETMKHGLNDDLRTLFELTKLDTLFQISETREKALASF